MGALVRIIIEIYKNKKQQIKHNFSHIMPGVLYTV